MPLKKDTREYFANVLKMSDDEIQNIEEGMATYKQQADAEGIDFKDQAEATETEQAAPDAAAQDESAPEGTMEAETAVKEAQPVSEAAPGEMQKVVEVMGDLALALKSLEGVIAVQSERLNALEAVTKELQVEDEQKLAATKSETPTASLEHIKQLIAIGRPEAVVDGRTALGKDAPQETKAQEHGLTNIPFLNEILAEE